MNFKSWIVKEEGGIKGFLANVQHGFNKPEDPEKKLGPTSTAAKHAFGGFADEINKQLDKGNLALQPSKDVLIKDLEQHFIQPKIIIITIPKHAIKTPINRKQILIQALDRAYEEMYRQDPKKIDDVNWGRYKIMEPWITNENDDSVTKLQLPYLKRDEKVNVYERYSDSSGVSPYKLYFMSVKNHILHPRTSLNVENPTAIIRHK